MFNILSCQYTTQPTSTSCDCRGIAWGTVSHIIPYMCGTIFYLTSMPPGSHLRLLQGHAWVSLPPWAWGTMLGAYVVNHLVTQHSAKHQMRLTSSQPSHQDNEYSQIEQWLTVFHSNHSILVYYDNNFISCCLVTQQTSVPGLLGLCLFC